MQKPLPKEELRRCKWSDPPYLSILELHLCERFLIQFTRELLSEGDHADGPVPQHGSQDRSQEAVPWQVQKTTRI